MLGDVGQHGRRTQHHRASTGTADGGYGSECRAQRRLDERLDQAGGRASRQDHEDRLTERLNGSAEVEPWIGRHADRCPEVGVVGDGVGTGLVVVAPLARGRWEHDDRTGADQGEHGTVHRHAGGRELSATLEAHDVRHAMSVPVG
jgi:hypothetical protein